MSWFGWGDEKTNEKKETSSSWFNWGNSDEVGQEEGCSESIVFDAPLDVCLSVITDYTKYPEFLSDMYETKIRKDVSDEVKEVYYSLNLKFTTIEYVLKLTKTENGVQWCHVELGPFLKNNGSWTLEEKNGKTHAVYTVDVAFSVYVPGFMKDYVVGSSLPTTLDAFKKRIESVYSKMKK